jgi:hypothetical protein
VVAAGCWVELCCCETAGVVTAAALVDEVPGEVVPVAVDCPEPAVVPDDVVAVPVEPAAVSDDVVAVLVAPVVVVAPVLVAPALLAGGVAAIDPLLPVMMLFVATAPLEAIEARNEVGSGAWRLASARLALAVPERKPTDPGAGMIIPIPAASRSILPSSLSDATLARSISLRV